jgi:chemotaxis protein MotB
MPVLRRRRATDHSEIDTEGSWAISYGDMITLLLTFFVLFYSTNKEKDRMNLMEESLLLSLQKNSQREPDKIEHPGQDPSLLDEMENLLKAKTYRVGNKLIVEFPEISFFDFGAIALTPKGERELKKFVQIYMPYAGNYILGIRAFTDNTKVKSKLGLRYQDNLELSALRAVSTMRTLQGLGVPLLRMRLGGYGELRLTASDLADAQAKEAKTKSGTRGLALARKVVLIVEPEPREKI